jgi:hypothetical protein
MSKSNDDPMSNYLLTLPVVAATCQQELTDILEGRLVSNTMMGLEYDADGGAWLL